MKRFENDPHKTTIPFRNVLITRFFALGDVAMTVPVVYSLCNAHPEINFVIITKEKAATLFINKPDNLQVEPVDFQKTYRGFFGANALCHMLIKKHDIEAIVDLQDEPKSWLINALMWLRGVHIVSIKKDRSGKRALTRHHGKRMLPLISSRQRYREAFYRMGLTFTETFTSIFANTQPSQKLFAEITQPKQDGEQWIAVAPFAQFKSKIYPIHLMEKVIEELHSWPNTHIFLLGAGDEEKAQFALWEEKFENVTSVAKKRYGFECELALLNYCDVVLCMDSANMHLASLVRTPVVSVWGSTHPYCGFMGWKQAEHNVVQLNMACRPCSVNGDRKCRFHDYFCLTGIKPELIITAVKQALSDKEA